MNRTQVVAALRELYVAHDGRRQLPFDKGCEWCDSRMARVMEVVDTYTASLSPGPDGHKYKVGAVIYHKHASWQRHQVMGVTGPDYFVRALFSAPRSPMMAYWNIEDCDKNTELEWQNDDIGRIGP